MNFGDAIEAMKKGNKIARSGWNGKGMFVVFMKPEWTGDDTRIYVNKYIAMFTAKKEWQPGWLASQEDIFSEDWEIVE